MSFETGETVLPDRIIISSDYETVALKQLVVADAPTMFDLIEVDRDHLSQFGDETASKYPSMESVVMSINFPKDERRLRFGIWDDERMVGSINLTPDAHNYNGVIGYWVGSEHTGHHYANRATRLLTNYAFSKLGLSSVSACVHVGNEASARTLEQAGFTYNGEFDGEWEYEYLNPNKNSARVRQADQIDENISMAVVELVGTNRRQRNGVSSTRYIVCNGEVLFEVDDEPRWLMTGEHITIPAGTVYRDAALGHQAVLLAISKPPFNPKDVEHVALQR